MKKEHALITLAALFYGTTIVGGQLFVNLGLSLYEIALFSMVLLVICTLPILLFRPQLLITRRFLPFFLVYGLIGAGAELAQFAGLLFGVPIAVITFLLYIQPLWTIFLGRLLLKEPVTGRKVIAAGLGLAGVALLLGAAWTGRMSASAAGLAAALVAGALLSLWIIFGRKTGISELHFVTTLVGWGSFTTFWLILLWPFASWLIRDPSIVGLSPNMPAAYWVYLLAFTLVSSLIPTLCFFRGLKSVDAGVAGIILLLEPVSASFLAWLFFGQKIGIEMILGGCLILLANCFVAGYSPSSGKHEISDTVNH